MYNQNLRQTPQTQEKYSYNDSKIKSQDLEAENQLLLNESILANQRARDLIISDNKLESFIKENSNLHIENEKLLKLAKQKKTESELWKSKYENQMQQIIQVKANYESEIRSLSTEVQKLLSRIEEFEFDKQRQVLDHKASIDAQANFEVDNVKKASNQHASLMEQQVRKLKDQVEEQTNELNDLQSKLLRQKAEDDSEIDRLLNVNELLRGRINQMEIEKQKELEDLNESLNQFTLQQIENLKQEFAGHSDIMEKEIAKLKGLLEIKNAEINTLVQQNQKMKAAFEEENYQLRDELSLLKQKLLEQERSARNYLEKFQDELNRQHEINLNELRNRYEDQLMNLQKEIGDLTNIINQKEQDIQIQLQEKQQQRQYYEGLIDQLKREIEEHKIRMFEIEKEKNREIEELNEQFRKAISSANEQIDQLKAQIQFLEGEIQKQKEHILIKNNELESHISQFSLQRRGLDDEIRKLKQELDKLKSDFLQKEKMRNGEIEELKLRNQRLDATLRDKIKQLEIQSEQILLDNKRLREQLDVNGQQFENLLCQKTLLEKDLKRARDELESTKVRLIQSDREKNIQFEDLKHKLEESNQYQINNLKMAFNTQIQVLNDENAKLKQSLESKQLDIHELLQKYENLKAEMAQGIPLGPEATTNKNIYDIYLKSKYKIQGEKSREI